MEEESGLPSINPLKITDFMRQSRKGVVATSLLDLTSKAKEKFGIQGDVTVVLEVDGTEIDDDEYFATLDPNTSLMILPTGQQWMPIVPRLYLDEVDDAKTGEPGKKKLVGLVDKLKNNICHISLLDGQDLEMLSDMDPDSIADITFFDKIFLNQLKEVSGRFLTEKRQAQDAIDLLKLYHEKDAIQIQSSDDFPHKTE